MKKLMIAALAATIAGAANAALYRWDAAMYYVYDGNAALQFYSNGKVEVNAWNNWVAVYATADANGNGTFAAVTGATEAEALALVPSDYRAVAVEANILTGTSTAYSTTPANPPFPGQCYETVTLTYESGTYLWENPQGTPEPTGGVMFLLGLAGLALRRKDGKGVAE